jgi:predicted transcriptional regulator
VDTEYWKTRCAAAERALQRARRLLRIGPQRKRVLQALASLKPGEVATTAAVAAKANVTHARALDLLRQLDGIGLVDRTNRGEPRGPGVQAKWRLGHLVQVAEA